MNFANRLQRYGRQKLVSFVQLKRQNFQPSKFEFNMEDLGKAYHLRKYLIEFSPKQDDKYAEEVEYLTNELNYWSAVRMIKLFLIFAGIVVVWDNYIATHQESNHDFAYKWHLQEREQSFIALKYGGFEEGDQ